MKYSPDPTDIFLIDFSLIQMQIIWPILIWRRTML